MDSESYHELLSFCQNTVNEFFNGEAIVSVDGTSKTLTTSNYQIDSTYDYDQGILKWELTFGREGKNCYLTLLPNSMVEVRYSDWDSGLTPDQFLTWDFS